MGHQKSTKYINTIWQDEAEIKGERAPADLWESCDSCVPFWPRRWL